MSNQHEYIAREVAIAAFSKALKDIATSPVEDLVPVIRCKDCIRRGTLDCSMYYEEEVSWEEDGYVEVDYFPHDVTSDDGFCNLGEREQE